MFHVGEQYYDPKWVNDILDRKILYQHEFYIPTDKDYFYSLLYRSLVQKPMVPEDHIEKLVNFSTKLKINNLTRENFSTDNVIIEILDAYMREMEYEYMPRGYSTFYNSEVVDFAIEKLSLIHI